MALTPEWRARIDRWREKLQARIYRPLEQIELEGFTTTDHLSAAEAAEAAFRTMPPGKRWGARWEYGWFRCTVTLPPEAAGHAIELRLNPAGEKLVFVDEVARGHGNILLTESGEPGRIFEVLAEAYAGHGPTPVHAGPVAPDEETLPEPPAAQRRVGNSSFGIRLQDAYGLYIDVETLLHLRDSLDADSLRVAEIDAGLRDFTIILDLELPLDGFLETVRAARQRLRPLLECRNGSTAPNMYAFGHAHLDVAWLWPLAETTRKAARTLSAQLALIERYPEHRFIHSQAELFRRLKAHYPQVWKRVKTAVADGNIIAEGSAWVEMDTNITGGESLIRQFIYGKQFFLGELGLDTELLWLPDVFGYSGAMPQIMRGCGVKYFATAKIFWAYKGGDPFPHNTFTWEGIDGSKVLVHLMNDYNSQMRPSDVIGRWRERRQKDGLSARLMPFGWGDGGGGPTADHLEFIRREEDLEGCPKVRLAGPIEYFHDLEERGVPDVNYVGELYFQAHRGAYTSQARTKRGCRKSELALREAEMWGAAASALAGYRFPADQIRQAWQPVLTNQFHDVLPGTSIARVYEEAEAAFESAISVAGGTRAAAQQALVDQQCDGVTAFNSLAWERTALVPLPEGFDGAVDAEGRSLPAQRIGGVAHAEVELPSCGWTTVRPAGAATPRDGASAGELLLENELLRVEFDDRGRIASIFDKETAREWAAGKAGLSLLEKFRETAREWAAGACNDLRMYRDVPANWDAWDLDSTYRLTPVELEDPVEFEVVAEGPLVATLRIRRTLNRSPLVQEVSLRRGSRRVTFETTVDWQERHKLLKVNFPVTIHADEALHEIQFGHLRRPTHRSRPYDADRYEVCNHKWTALTEEGRGFAVLNDCKYGVNVDGNTIALTLLRSPMAPDMNADRGRQEFAYALYAWNGSLFDSRLVREAYELNCPVTTVAGAASEDCSLFSVDAHNVVVETVKPAEDGSGDIVVRLYESMRTATTCSLTTSLPVAAAQETDMLERQRADLGIADGKIELDFRPFEIKTVRLQMA